MKKICIFALAACLLLALAACSPSGSAASPIIPDEVWQNSNHFHPTNAALELIPDSVQTPDASVTENGATLAIRQTIADRYLIYVLFDVTVPEDAGFDPDANTHHVRFDIQTDQRGTKGCEELRLLESSDSRHTYLFIYFRVPNCVLMPGPATLSFVYPDSPTGMLSVTWDFSYADLSRTVRVSSPCTIGGQTVGNPTVTLTPLSLCVYLLDCSGHIPIYWETQIEIRLKDGTVLPVPTDGILDGIKLGGESEEFALLYYRLDRVLDIAQVEQVNVDGVAFVF